MPRDMFRGSVAERCRDACGIGLAHRGREHTGKYLRAPTSNCHRWRGVTSVSIANRNKTVTEMEKLMIDKDLKQHVQNALDWEPSVDAKDIGVSVDQGVVTLRGNVASYAEKIAAERVALRVYGVKAVANDLAVHLANAYQRTDTEIAQAAVSAPQMAFRCAG